MKTSLWTRNFTLIIAASALGSIGNIAGSYALSLCVFDETNSTLASALILAIQLIPYFVIPLFVAPVMDHKKRKPFLVGGDFLNGILYGAAGIYLLFHPFSYIEYLLYSLLLATLGSFDELAYNSFYPRLIPKGAEEKGYTVSGMLYPVLKVIITPLAAMLYGVVGVTMILIMQGILSILAACVESFIKVEETVTPVEHLFSLGQWKKDIGEAYHYLKREKGLMAMYIYMAVTNGVASGYTPLVLAYFRTTPGLTMTMYSLFTGAEFIGRTVGGMVTYNLNIKKEKKYWFCLMVYVVYETMDMLLLWLAYPLMLINRGIAGFLGVNSAAMRQAAVQKYIPESLRARINAFQSMCIMAASSVLTVLMGMLGEWMDYRMVVTLSAGMTLLVCFATIFRRRKEIRKIYEC